ncbi:MAG: hypothetical protein DLM53_10690 [Candidatus Eremiobacter antarcticus]|nr:MAG: hypothetical protein DLM53_10690 [Candidatus Eremiobacter sp. RRmetagenome_bin22]
MLRVRSGKSRNASSTKSASITMNDVQCCQKLDPMWRCTCIGTGTGVAGATSGCSVGSGIGVGDALRACGAVVDSLSMDPPRLTRLPSTAPCGAI